ncbi:MAG: hypothetical protein N2323_03675 [candidate division WOR-3 bacterium]|nr:hypothetical protein [candidate division WOR-3 bacterium]MDW8113918.1 hypothetical protein [candidate division WOR-3 bacterium]
MAKIKKRISYKEAEEMIKIIGERLKDIKFGVYGSYIRKEETIGDLDMLIKEEDLEKVKELLKDLPFYERIEFYSLPRDYYNSWESFALYLIGSGKFNIWLRSIAKRKGYLLNQYGLFKRDNGEMITSKEKEIFQILNIEFIPYEKRKGIYQKEWKSYIRK